MIPIKALQYAKQRTGFGLPHWLLYYKACALVWIKECIVLENDGIPKLGGHYLNLVWHAFLCYQKEKDNKQCNNNHLIRKALNWVWTKIQEENYLNGSHQWKLSHNQHYWKRRKS